ncbi:MAG: energy-coupling factor transporter transmembrane component T [Clostridiales bacterium]|nr:energy-coupling factor transporter transmembrane component T [Clostridiales bacterium]
MVIRLVRNQDAFGSYHPAVNFLYFGVLLSFSMFSMHPVCLMISAVCAATYYVTLNGAKSVKFLIRGVLPLFLMTVIINPAFSHEGQTILTYLPTGNPLTLESILYGAAAGIMMVGILLWFACFSQIMTSDKFVYLFGRIIPALSLLLSMTLRFVPRFKVQFDTVREVQRALGRDTYHGGLLKRMKNAVACFSIVVTWSMENAIETADSMKNRGYGSKKRTAYSIYSWEDRDRTVLCFLIFCGLFLLAGGISGNLFWRYFPSVRGVMAEPLTILMEMTFLMLCAMPVYLERKEKSVWNSFKSNN